MKPTIFGTDSYQLFINLGTVFGSFAFFIAKYRRTKRIGQSFFSLAGCLAIFGIGAIAGEIVRTWNFWEFHSFSDFVHTMATDRMGTHFAGRVLFAAWVFPAIYWLIKKFGKACLKSDVQSTYDAAAFYFVIQHIFDRIGCFLNGCCYGKYYAGFGSVVFPVVPGHYPVYPSQLMEAVAAAGALIFLLVRWKRQKPLFGWALVLFGEIIFISEFFMDQTGVLRIAGINMIQVTAFLIILSGVFCIDKSKEREKKIS